MSAEQGLTEAPVQQQAPAESFNGSGGNQAGGFELDEDGQRVPHGQGQSKSSRRRRRKRKGKSGDGAEGEQAIGGASTEGGGEEGASIQASGDAAPVQAARRSDRPQNGGGQQNGAAQNGPAQNGAAQNGLAPGGTKRWKKKFRDRDRREGAPGGGMQQNGGGFTQAAPQGGGFQNNGYQGNGGGFRGPDTHQPGNGGGGFKRKGGFGGGGGGKQQSRGRSGFVGPMDHSYRPANGNVFDSSSTVDMGGQRGRHTGDSQPIDYSQGRAIPIAPDAPTHIYFFIEDLFFTAKIQETARKLGVKVAFIKNEKEQIAALTAGEDADKPGLIVFDLNNANAKPLTLIPKLKTKLKKSTSIVGFLSHLQGDLKAKAMEAGCDTVMPRAAFSQNLPNLLRRYGIEETEDHANYNQ
jgi:CheY-like chemotaxis protein